MVKYLKREKGGEGRSLRLSKEAESITVREVKNNRKRKGDKRRLGGV